MSKARQFCLLFWKNWTLAKRSPIRTFFELVLPLLFILILVLLRALVIKDEHKSLIKYEQFTVNQLPIGLKGTDLSFAYGPNTSDVEDVMREVVSQLGFKNSSGFTAEKKMVDFLLGENDVASKYLGGVYFHSTPNKANIVYKLRLSSRARNKKGKQKPSLLKDPSNNWNTQLTFNVFQIPGPRNKNSSHGGPPDYYDEGFLAIQHAVDMAILKYRGEDTKSLKVKMQRFPYPDYIEDNFIIVIQQTLPQLLMLSLIFTALCIVRDIVHEKERKLKVCITFCTYNFSSYMAS
jgi:ATP-binding cassette subfamily A (ABC1) protein 3